jgi:periplasmic glucans biosynthesis protein
MSNNRLRGRARPPAARPHLVGAGLIGCAVLGVWLIVASLSSRAPAAPASFGFDDVYALARSLAAQPYRAPEEQLPPLLRYLTYDEYRDIRFKPQRALWRDAHLPFQVQFFLPGFYFNRTVTINVIDDRGVHRIPFSPDFFAFGRLFAGSRDSLVQALPPTLGFAGFRLHYPINTPSTEDEFAVFLGASYFRAIGKGQSYGLSARGLAIDTATPGGEEFPAFTQYWLRTPAPTAHSVTIYALLEGPSVTGAYEFQVEPGEPTRMDVTAAIFLRRHVSVLGIAPLSSMFYHGKNSDRSFGDFRPEVHDSDGLLIAARNGEWIWRPLVNPQEVLTNAFLLDSPRGFGLLQRDRNFDHYQDLESRYELRPSAWIVPRGDWGPGDVRLIQIPSARELDDNIVAMWVPAQLPTAGTPLRIAYQIVWGAEDRALPPAPGGRVVATRIGTGAAVPGVASPPGKTYVLDFAGDALNALPSTADVKAIVTAGSAGQIVEQHVEKNPVSGGWRVSFRLQFTEQSGVELRCYLKYRSDVLTETWTYLAQP